MWEQDDLTLGHYTVHYTVKDIAGGDIQQNSTPPPHHSDRSPLLEGHSLCPAKSLLKTWALLPNGLTSYSWQVKHI